MLLDPTLCDQCAGLGFVVGIDALSFGGYSADADISPVELLGKPVLLEKVLAGQQAPEECSKANQEDTCAGIGAGACGRPGHGVERSGGAGEEDHRHG